MPSSAPWRSISSVISLSIISVLSCKDTTSQEENKIIYYFLTRGTVYLKRQIVKISARRVKTQIYLQFSADANEHRLRRLPVYRNQGVSLASQGGRGLSVAKMQPQNPNVNTLKACVLKNKMGGSFAKSLLSIVPVGQRKKCFYLQIEMFLTANRKYYACE